MGLGSGEIVPGSAEEESAGEEGTECGKFTTFFSSISSVDFRGEVEDPGRAAMPGCAAVLDWVLNLSFEPNFEPPNPLA